MQLRGFKYHHLGMPTKQHRPGEEYLPEYKIYHSGFQSDEFGIEWMYYENECDLPEIVKTMPHIAFEVDDIAKAIEGRNVIIEPNSPSAGVLVAFIEHDGMPIEFIQTNVKDSRQASIPGT